MPRPTVDVNGAEYQALLRGREMYRLYGARAKEMIGVEETLARLEKELPFGAYSERDRADLRKAKDILAPFYAKAAGQEEHTTTHYIWRTQGDDRVRPDHAANDGEIFAWDNPPPTGHPGEAPGCRCHAEPYKPPTEIHDPPIKPVYPVETLIATIYGGRILNLALSVLRRKPQEEQPRDGERLTDHGYQRVEERSITEKDIDTAIETAKKTGNITIKNGPYNTPQHHYHGSNGLTVIVETKGRNAGKIITTYGKKPGGKL